MEDLTLEDKIFEISTKINQIGTIAFVAASASFEPSKCEAILDDVLYAIKNLSEQISNELDDICIKDLRGGETA